MCIAPFVAEEVDICARVCVCVAARVRVRRGTLLWCGSTKPRSLMRVCGADARLARRNPSAGEPPGGNRGVEAARAGWDLSAVSSAAGSASLGLGMPSSMEGGRDIDNGAPGLPFAMRASGVTMSVEEELADAGDGSGEAGRGIVVLG